MDVFREKFMTNIAAKIALLHTALDAMNSAKK